MAELLPYPIFELSDVVAKLRDLRTSQVTLLRNINASKRVMPFVAKKLMLDTMQSHIDALGNAIAMLATLQGVQAALNTEERGEALVEVAKNACRAEQELATLIKLKDCGEMALQ